MSTLNGHIRSHEVGFRLPHVQRPIHASCIEAIRLVSASHEARHVPPPIKLPSGEYPQAFTLVRAPRSFDLTTITVFCFRLFSTSHILTSCQSQPTTISRLYSPNSRVHRAGDERLRVLGMPCASREFGDVATKHMTVGQSDICTPTYNTYDVFFMSRMYGSPLIYVALPVRSDCPLR